MSTLSIKWFKLLEAIMGLPNGGQVPLAKWQGTGQNEHSQWAGNTKKQQEKRTEQASKGLPPELTNQVSGSPSQEEGGKEVGHGTEAEFPPPRRTFQAWGRSIHPFYIYQPSTNHLYLPAWGRDIGTDMALGSLPPSTFK